MKGQTLLRGECVLVAAIALLGGPLEGVIPSELHDSEYALEPTELKSQWQEFPEAMEQPEAVRATFREERENDFRRGSRTFRGILRMWSDRGASLHYTEPSEVTLVAMPDAVWRRPAGGEWTSYARNAESESAVGSEDLWRFDFDALAETYTFHGRRALLGSWELLLTPKDDYKLPRLYLKGSGKTLNRIEIEHNPRRRTIFILQDIERSPSTEGWSTYFPEK